MRLASASRNYSRNLVADVETAGGRRHRTRGCDIDLAGATLHQFAGRGGEAP